MSVLHLIAELWLCFDLVRKSRSAIAEMRYASIESKRLLRKLRCASENVMFKVRLLFRAFNGLNSRCVLLRCAFVKLYLCPLLENKIFLSTVCLLKKSTF